jgi:steroid 5-alpha reductase family enzyme
LKLLLILFFYYNFLFLVAVKTKNNSVVDIGWGIAFIVTAIILLLESSKINLLQLFISLLVIAWGLRLSLHIYHRSKGMPEDYRYAEWRRQWQGNFLIRSYFQVFILQMFLMFVIALPLFLIQRDSFVQTITAISFLGMAISVIGILYESISDRQLSQFKENPNNKGKIMQQGLWRFSRHPNYFGESCFWLGIAIAVFPVKNGYLALCSFLTITILLRFVSGVPMLEKKAKQKPEFKKYAENTSCFIPWFPTSGEGK